MKVFLLLLLNYHEYSWNSTNIKIQNRINNSDDFSLSPHDAQFKSGVYAMTHSTRPHELNLNQNL